MKNLFILAFMLMGMMTSVNAQTTITFQLPNADHPSTFVIDAPQ